MAEQKKALVEKKVIADLFSVSVRRVEQLNEAGTIKGEGRPMKFDLLPTVKRYIKYQSDIISGKQKKEVDESAESLKLNGEARIKQAKAEMEELRLKELKGNLHAAEDVKAVMTDMILNIRSMMIAMPGKLAVDLANIDNAAEVAERLKKEIYYVLDRAAEYEYDPEEFAERVRNREGWDALNEEGED